MRYIERETKIEVDITGLPPWDGEPVVSLVTYPSGRRYTMRPELIPELFDVVRPQVVEMGGVAGGLHDRPTSRQGEVTRRWQRSAKT